MPAASPMCNVPIASQTHWTRFLRTRNQPASGARPNRRNLLPLLNSLQVLIGAIHLIRRDQAAFSDSLCVLRVTFAPFAVQAFAFRFLFPILTSARQRVT